MPKPRLLVVSSPDDLAVAALSLVARAERAALEANGMFRVALAGGSTPRRLYQRIAGSRHFDFARWQVFFGDERWVAADDAGSNYRMARESLLDHVPIPASHVHPVDVAAGSPAKAAELYALDLRRTLAPAPSVLPRFDLVLLGLGADGHTASLFPGSSALVAGPHELVVATWVAAQRAWRITLTAALLSAASRVVFLVSGADKAEALARVLDGGDAHPPPAARIRPSAGTLTFVADEDAARLLKGVEIG